MVRTVRRGLGGVGDLCVGVLRRVLVLSERGHNTVGTGSLRMQSSLLGVGAVGTHTRCRGFARWAGWTHLGIGPDHSELGHTA
jgi:hypothetical protein